MGWNSSGYNHEGSGGEVDLSILREYVDKCNIAKSAANNAKTQAETSLHEIKDLIDNFDPTTDNSYPGISQENGNILITKPDGLYVPEGENSGTSGNRNIDGGSAFSMYLADQHIGGGNAEG